MDFEWTPALRDLAEEATAVALEWADASAPDGSWVSETSGHFALEMAARGWLGMTWPVADGGFGRPPLERFVVTEALIGSGAPVGAAYIADRQIGPVLIEFGTADQRRQFLPDLMAGRSNWCIGLSEPDAGSDLASLRTRANADGDDFIVNGQKVWTTGALWADWCYLVVRTDPTAVRHRGVSELIVDMSSPGISVAPIQDLTGSKTFCEVRFDDVRVPARNLVGALNGSFSQVMRHLEHERGGIDRLVGNHRLFLDARCLVAGDPRFRQEIAALESSYQIGRLLVLRDVLGQASQGASAVTKIFCAEHQQRVASFAARAGGPNTMLWERYARGLCYASAYSIMGGTHEVLRNVIGERMLGLPRRGRSPPRPPSAGQLGSGGPREGIDRGAP